MEKQITKKQHYVPQVYLKGFSEDNKTIFYYDLEKHKRSADAVPINSVCYKNFIYELRNEKNELLLPNYLETVFAALERMFSQYRVKIQKKANHFLTWNKNVGLTQSEIVFWSTFLTIQSMRVPAMIERVNLFCHLYWKDILDENQISNLAIQSCLPLFEEIKDENNLLCQFVKPMANMIVSIGIDKEGRLFTSDCPVYERGNQNKVVSNGFFSEFEEIIFPITNEICLLFFSNDEAKNAPSDNFFFVLSDEWVDKINWSVSYNAERFVFSKSKIDQVEINKIRNSHLQKLEDEIKIARIWESSIQNS